LRCAPPISVTKTALRPEPPRYSPRRNCPLMSWPSQRFQVSIISPVCITSPALAGYCMRASAVSISGNRTYTWEPVGYPGHQHWLAPLGKQPECTGFVDLVFPAVYMFAACKHKRSEERRVGKSVDNGGSRRSKKKK